MTWTWTTALPTIFKEYTTAERDALGDPPENVVIFNTTANQHETFFESVWSPIVTGDTASVDNELVRWNGTGGNSLNSPSTEESTLTATLNDQADLTLYNAVNDGNPAFLYGASTTERLVINPTYASGTQVIDYIHFLTQTGSVAADAGEFRFSVDAEAFVLTIDDGGIEIKASGSLSFGAVDILTDSAGTTTLKNIDIIDTITGAAIEADVDHDLLVGFESNEHFTQANIIATGAINAGSITSGFTSIDVGSGAITTTGAIVGITAANLVDKSATEVIAGSWDFGGAADLEIPNSATPTVDTAGQIAIDTTITDHTALIRYFGSEELIVIAVPTDKFTTTDGHVISYNAANNEFEMVAAGAADNLGDHAATQDIEMGSFNIQTAGVITLKEQAAADADVASEGQLWVNTDTPNTLAFTDDAGNDHEISGIRFITIRLIDVDTNVATETSIGGDWVCPFTGVLIQDDDYKGYFSANVDTAGTTGTMVIDVHKGGSTVMTTNKLDIETTETSTITATTQPDLTTTAVTAGDKFTFDIDAIQTTAAKGLSVTMAIRMKPQV